MLSNLELSGGCFPNDTESAFKVQKFEYQTEIVIHLYFIDFRFYKSSFSIKISIIPPFPCVFL